MRRALRRVTKKKKRDVGIREKNWDVYTRSYILYGLPLIATSFFFTTRGFKKALLSPRESTMPLLEKRRVLKDEYRGE